MTRWILFNQELLVDKKDIVGVSIRKNVLSGTRWILKIIFRNMYDKEILLSSKEDAEKELQRIQKELEKE